MSSEQDKVNAIIEDPATPDNVRRTLSEQSAANAYVDSVDVSDDGAGNAVVTPRNADEDNAGANDTEGQAEAVSEQVEEAEAAKGNDADPDVRRDPAY